MYKVEENGYDKVKYIRTVFKYSTSVDLLSYSPELTGTVHVLILQCLQIKYI